MGSSGSSPTTDTRRPTSHFDHVPVLSSRSILASNAARSNFAVSPNASADPDAVTDAPPPSAVTSPPPGVPVAVTFAPPTVVDATSPFIVRATEPPEKSTRSRGADGRAFAIRAASSLPAPCAVRLRRTGGGASAPIASLMTFSTWLTGADAAPGTLSRIAWTSSGIEIAPSDTLLPIS